MEATTTEIAPDVFRLSVTPPDSPVSFGAFLIRDEQPAMVETGMRGMYPPIRWLHGRLRRERRPDRAFEVNDRGAEGFR